MLQSYAVAGLQGCSALRKAFFSNGSAAHPWVVEAPQRKAAYLYKGESNGCGRRPEAFFAAKPSPPRGPLYPQRPVNFLIIPLPVDDQDQSWRCRTLSAAPGEFFLSKDFHPSMLPVLRLAREGS